MHNNIVISALIMLICRMLDPTQLIGRREPTVSIGVVRAGKVRRPRVSTEVQGEMC